MTAATLGTGSSCPNPAARTSPRSFSWACARTSGWVGGAWFIVLSSEELGQWIRHADSGGHGQEVVALVAEVEAAVEGVDAQRPGLGPLGARLHEGPVERGQRQGNAGIGLVEVGDDAEAPGTVRDRHLRDAEVVDGRVVDVEVNDDAVREDPGLGRHAVVEVVAEAGLQGVAIVE